MTSIFYGLSLWNCMISIFGLWRLTWPVHSLASYRQFCLASFCKQLSSSFCNSKLDNSASFRYQLLAYYLIPLIVIGTTYALIIRKLYKVRNAAFSPSPLKTTAEKLLQVSLSLSLSLSIYLLKCSFDTSIDT